MLGEMKFDPELPDADAAIQRLGKLIREAQASAYNDPALQEELDLDAKLGAEITLGVRGAANIVRYLMRDDLLAAYVLGCWLDTTFPRTLVAMYAARRALESADPAESE